MLAIRDTAHIRQRRCGGAFARGEMGEVNVENEWRMDNSTKLVNGDDVKDTLVTAEEEKRLQMSAEGGGR